MKSCLESLPQSQKIDDSNGESRIDFGLSNLNFPAEIIAFGGVKKYREVLGEIDPDGDILPAGIELTPTRAFMRSLNAYLGKKSDDSEDLLDFAGNPLWTSVHQSWGEGVDGVKDELSVFAKNILRGHFQVPSLARLGGAALLLDQHDSLYKLANMCWRTNNEVRAVIFGEHTHKGSGVDFAGFDFSPTSMQLKPEIKAVRDAQKYPEALTEFLSQHGIDGITIDNHHFLRGDKNDPEFHLDHEAILSAIQQENIPILSIHASLGRTDAQYKEDRHRSLEDLDCMFNYDNDFSLRHSFDVMDYGYRIWRAQQAEDNSRLPVTLEIPYKALMSKFNPIHVYSDDKVGQSREHLPLAQFGSATRQVVQSLKQPFEYGEREWKFG